MATVSIIIPAYNEARGIATTIRQVQEAFADSPHQFEIIAVDDGSKDETAKLAYHAGATVIHHPYNIGYGNALLTGIRHARHELVAITDADGTYPVAELPAMVDELLERRLDMLVGTRGGKQYRGGLAKRLGRLFFKVWAEFTCGRTIPDINSGLRVMRRSMVMQFARVLCGGFSFTTTITVVAILSNCFVGYRDVAYAERIGKSHVRYLRDTLRTSQILVMTILLFNPIKLFLPYAAAVAFVGVVAAALGVLFPAAQGALMIGSLAVMVAALIMGFGFFAEQRRAITTFVAGNPGSRVMQDLRIREPGEEEEETPVKS